MNFWSLIKGVISFIKEKVTRVYQVYKSRTSPYKEMIYSKQLEGFSETIDALSDFYVAASIFIGTHGNKLNDKTRIQLRNQIMGEATAFNKSYQKWAVFLPKELIYKLHDYFDLFNGISASPKDVTKYPKEHVYADNPRELLSDSYIKALNTARKFIGTEPLSQEILKLVGKK